jgi:basic membrane protein A
MRAGEFTRFDVFKGPIKDNQGNVVVAEGKTMTQEDLEGLRDIPGRTSCEICMDWLVEGMVGTLPSKKQ